MLNIDEGTEKKETNDNLNADVLVIGSGAAGLRAAVSIIETDINLNVIVLNKGEKNNCTSYADNSFEISGGGGCGLSAVLDDKDSVDKYYDDLSKIAMGRNNKRLTRLFSEQATDAINYIRELGVKFEHKDNNLTLVKEIWHQESRMAYSKHGTGNEVLRVLKSKAEEYGINILNDSFAYRLYKKNEQISGCLTYNKKTEKSIYIQCKSIIIATGGAGGLFRHTTNPRHLTGDGILLSHEVGAKLCNMDLYDDIPMSLSQPRSLGFIPALLLSGVNHSVPELLDMETVTWKYNKNKLPEKDFISSYPETYQRIKRSNFNFETDSITFGWAAHFMLGGIEINCKCETSVKGLYSAGEVSGGVNGSGRLPGTGIVDGLVLGKIAGKEAAQFVSQLPVKKSKTQKIQKAGLKTIIFTDSVLNHFKTLQQSLSELLYSAFRENNLNKINEYNKEVNKISNQFKDLLECDANSFNPISSQAQIILELRSSLLFSTIYINARYRCH